MMNSAAARTNVADDNHIVWIDPAMTRFRAVVNRYYLEWLDLAESRLSTVQGSIEEAGDVVHEAIVELLDSMKEGYTLKPKDRMNMYIKRSISLICHVAESGKYWTAS